MINTEQGVESSMGLLIINNDSPLMMQFMGSVYEN